MIRWVCHRQKKKTRNTYIDVTLYFTSYNSVTMSEFETGQVENFTGLRDEGVEKCNKIKCINLHLFNTKKTFTAY